MNEVSWGEGCGCGDWDGGQCSATAGACGNCGQLPLPNWGLALLLTGGSLESLVLNSEDDEEEE
jgi:hypothetical protein